MRFCLASPVPDLRDRILQAGFVHIRAEGERTLLSQPFCDGPPDARRCPRHDRHLALHAHVNPSRLDVRPCRIQGLAARPVRLAMTRADEWRPGITTVTPDSPSAAPLSICRSVLPSNVSS